MVKKRKAPRKSEPSGPREVDAKDARLTVKTFEDVADSEDDHWADQDRIDFDDDDDQPRSKRLKRQEKEDAFLEVSDEEILGEDDESEEEEEEAQASLGRRSGKKAAARGGAGSEDEEGGDGGEEEEGDEGWWGASKREYYNADNIETEADALVGHLPALIDCSGLVLICIAGGRSRSSASAGQEAGQDARG